MMSHKIFCNKDTIILRRLYDVFDLRVPQINNLPMLLYTRVSLEPAFSVNWKSYWTQQMDVPQAHVVSKKLEWV